MSGSSRSSGSSPPCRKGVEAPGRAATRAGDGAADRAVEAHPIEMSARIESVHPAWREARVEREGRFMDPDDLEGGGQGAGSAHVPLPLVLTTQSPCASVISFMMSSTLNFAGFWRIGNSWNVTRKFATRAWAPESRYTRSMYQRQ